MARAAAVLLLAAAAVTQAEVTPLHTGWNLQSACKVESEGAAISTTAFIPWAG